MGTLLVLGIVIFFGYKIIQFFAQYHYFSEYLTNMIVDVLSNTNNLEKDGAIDAVVELYETHANDQEIQKSVIRIMSTTFKYITYDKYNLLEQIHRHQELENKFYALAHQIQRQAKVKYLAKYSIEDIEEAIHVAFIEHENEFYDTNIPWVFGEIFLELNNKELQDSNNTTLLGDSGAFEIEIDRIAVRGRLMKPRGENTTTIHVISKENSELRRKMQKNFEWDYDMDELEQIEAYKKRIQNDEPYLDIDEEEIPF